MEEAIPELKMELVLIGYAGDVPFGAVGWFVEMCQGVGDIGRVADENKHRVNRTAG